MQTWCGLKIFVDPNVLEDTEERLFPESKHRSKRIHKKLVKRFGGEFMKAPCILKAPTAIYMHPVRYAEFQQQLAKESIT